MSDDLRATGSRAALIADVLRGIRFVLTDDNFPFYNRHPHHTTAHTITMWAEKDVLAVIDSAIEAFDCDQHDTPFLDARIKEA